MKALIVDDEKHCRENLEILLKQNCPQVTMFQSCSSVDHAVKTYETFKPDLLFLDINMPGKDGFQLLNEVDAVNVAVVFVTAHNEHALRAIKSGPTGYILKPIDPTELCEVVSQTMQRIQTQRNSSASYSDALTHLSTNLKAKRPPNRLCLTHMSKLELVEVRNIVFISSDSYYSTFNRLEGKPIVMSKTLKYYEGILGAQFIRVHRSYLVNLDHIKEFLFEMSELIMSDGSKIPVSRRKVHSVVEVIKVLS